jgi:hypothetical protein
MPARNKSPPVTSSGDVDPVAVATSKGGNPPDRLATPPLRPGPRFNRQCRYRGNGVAPYNTATEIADREEGCVIADSQAVSPRVSIKSGERKTLRSPHRHRHNGVIR